MVHSESSWSKKELVGFGVKCFLNVTIFFFDFFEVQGKYYDLKLESNYIESVVV